jgi:outer membrane protein
MTAPPFARTALSFLLVLACAAQGAAAAGLVEVWQAAVQNDREYAVGKAAHATAQPRRDQASALWKPGVAVTASMGLATNESQTRGAQFSAPGFGQSSGVGFSTSVTHGTSGRWSIAATQPLYNPARRAQQQQLGLSADLADLEWQEATQALMLRTAQRYFDAALADEAVRVLQVQLDAVQRAATEAQDRFKLGSSPVTDIHETGARLASVRAQLLAAQSNQQVQRNALADSTGLPESALAARLPARPVQGADAGVSTRGLQPWLGDAQAGNPAIRSRLLAAEVARQEAARYSLRSAAAVDLVAQAGRDRLSGNGDFGAASNTANNGMVGVQLTMTLSPGGYRNAKEEEALRLADKAQAEVELTRQQVAQQVRAAWLGLSVGAGRVQALDDALAASLARRDATQLGREVGQRTTLDLLNAENDTAAARLALAQARVGLLMDRLRLAALAGQLDEAGLRGVDGELMPPPS